MPSLIQNVQGGPALNLGGGGAGTFLQSKPADYNTLIADQDWVDYTDSVGNSWTELNEVPAGAMNGGVTDASAPSGDGKVFEFAYLNAQYNGSGAGSMNKTLSPAPTALYVSMRWYASANPFFVWANYSNKLLYLGDPSSDTTWIIEMSGNMNNYPDPQQNPGNYFIMHNNGNIPGNANIGYPWGLGEGSGNPTHSGTMPIYNVYQGNWYEIECVASQDTDRVALWARKCNVGDYEATPTCLFDVTVDQSSHTWSKFHLQSILGGGVVNVNVGQYYHHDHFTAYKP